MATQPATYRDGFTNDKIVGRKAHLLAEAPDRIDGIHFDQPDFFAAIVRRHLDLHLRVWIDPLGLDEFSSDCMAGVGIEIHRHGVMRADSRGKKQCGDCRNETKGRFDVQQ